MVVDFTASWSRPCRFIAPVLADWARKMVDVIFLKVDVDELKVIFIYISICACLFALENFVKGCHVLMHEKFFVFFNLFFNLYFLTQ